MILPQRLTPNLTAEDLKDMGIVAACCSTISAALRLAQTAKALTLSSTPLPTAPAELNFDGLVGLASPRKRATAPRTAAFK
jgi:hypothetical protein